MTHLIQSCKYLKWLQNVYCIHSLKFFKERKSHQSSSGHSSIFTNTRVVISKRMDVCLTISLLLIEWGKGLWALLYCSLYILMTCSLSSGPLALGADWTISSLDVLVMQMTCSSFQKQVWIAGNGQQMFRLYETKEIEIQFKCQSNRIKDKMCYFFKVG